MTKIILPIIVILALLLSSCSSNAMSESTTADLSAVGIPKEYGYNFVIFDSDGDGVKDDIAKLTCLGMSGGYGSFRLEVFTSKEESYTKAFDSEEYTMDDATYQNLSENIDGELMIDSFYSVEALDTDGDGCEELICRQYAWIDYHANHVGDVVSAIKVTDGKINIIQQRLEPQT